jgi:hypothetical protein
MFTSTMAYCVPLSLWNKLWQQQQQQQQQQEQLFVVARPGQVVLQNPTWNKFTFSLSKPEEKRGPFLKTWQQHMTTRYREAGIPWTMYAGVTRWVTQQLERHGDMRGKVLAVLVGAACVCFFWLMKRRGVLFLFL